MQNLTTSNPNFTTYVRRPPAEESTKTVDDSNEALDLRSELTAVVDPDANVPRVNNLAQAAPGTDLRSEIASAFDTYSHDVNRRQPYNPTNPGLTTLQDELAEVRIQEPLVKNNHVKVEPANDLHSELTAALTSGWVDNLSPNGTNEPTEMQMDLRSELKAVDNHEQ